MKIFISHSSKDLFVSNFVDFLIKLGINANDIFCSSLEGQGVKNGERINDSVKKALNDSSLIIYLISHNFINSTYCTQELGALWAINESKNYFIFKFDDVKNEEIKGFVDSSYKYNLLNTDGLSSLYDVLLDLFGICNKQAVINRAINSLLEALKKDVEILIEDKDKTSAEIEEKRQKALEKQYEDLSIGEKLIIGSIYYSKYAVGYYSASNGTIGLLASKFFVVRTSNVSSGFMQFAYALQSWVIKFIKRNEAIQKELTQLIKKNGEYLDDGGFY
ncbi:MAG: TIR domain-containing protein [Acholeplasmatales bacterium]|nr:TIR domain-containing protein [Acholeplasmatales bacterium]